MKILYRRSLKKSFPISMGGGIRVRIPLHQKDKEKQGILSFLCIQLLDFRRTKLCVDSGPNFSNGLYILLKTTDFPMFLSVIYALHSTALLNSGL